MKALIMRILLSSLMDLIFSLFITLALMETPDAHVFLNTLGKMYLLSCSNLLGIPLLFVWTLPWWAIYLVVVFWINQWIFYYEVKQIEKEEKEW